MLLPAWSSSAKMEENIAIKTNACEICVRDALQPRKVIIDQWKNIRKIRNSIRRQREVVLAAKYC